ncbi:MAG: hypothetical protein V9E87_08465 [Gemmatimonadales bacterium]
MANSARAWRTTVGSPVSGSAGTFPFTPRRAPRACSRATRPASRRPPMSRGAGRPGRLLRFPAASPSGARVGRAVPRSPSGGRASGRGDGLVGLPARFGEAVRLGDAARSAARIPRPVGR